MDERLLKASESGDLSTVRKLLKKLPLVDPNKQDVFYSSCLSKACQGGYFDVAQLLIEAQADVNSRDVNSLTPLHHAAKGNHVEVVKLLLLNGARLDFVNNANLRPIDLVRYNTETWDILHDAQQGDMPEIEEYSEVPVIPDFAILGGTTKKTRKGTGKKGKKGKKGKGKKSGKKKKGKKKKK